MKKRLFAILLTVILCIGILPSFVFAATGGDATVNITASAGTVTENAYISVGGKLTISLTNLFDSELTFKASRDDITVAKVSPVSLGLEQNGSGQITVEGLKLGTVTITITTTTEPPQDSNPEVAIITLTVRDTCTVTFDSNGGSTSSPPSKTVTYASAYGELAAVSRQGYEFAGWYTDADAGTKVTDETTVASVQDHTLYAHWTAKPQTIIYNSNTGSGTMGVTTGDTDSSVALSANTFTKAGYSFGGWNTAANGSGTNYSDKQTIDMPAGGLTLYAQWTATVTFNGNGGGTPTPLSKPVIYASTYGDLATVSRDGYAFLGWYTEAVGGTKVTSATTVPDVSDHTLYARWDAELQTITYNNNTGAGMMANTTGDTDSSVTLRKNDFTKAGYTFDKWNTAANGSGTNYSDKQTITMPAHGLTLYAQWDADPQTITYKNNTGSGAMDDTTGDTDASVALRENIFTKAGYSFTGWNTAADGSGTSYTDGQPITMPVGGLTLYAQWDANLQTITYTNNTGSGTMEDTMGDTDASVTLSANTFTKAGYIFAGWNTEADGSGTSYTDGQPITMPVGGLTLYAQWDTDLLAITYMSNTGSGTMDYTTADTDTSVTLSPNTFTKAGYTFAGWNTAADGGGIPYDDGQTITMPADGLMLYAQWDPEPQTITYISNTGSGTMDDTTDNTDASVDLRANAFVKAGYTFAGWNTEADGSGTSYDDVQNITMPAGGLTLYARWEAQEQTITYNNNAGSGTMDDTTGDTDASVTLSANTFTKSGYVFAGWNTEADGSGTNYSNRQNITMPAGGLTLYAQWADYIYGDIDGDGEINDIDRTKLARYLAGWNGNEIIERAADVNEDGSINDIDRTILARYLAGWSGYETLPYNE